MRGEKRALGRQTDALVRAAHIPVCVIRPGPRKLDKIRYVIAVDSQRQTLSSVQFVLNMAQNTDEVVIITLNADATQANADLQAASAVAAQVPTNARHVHTQRVPRNPAIGLGPDLCQTVSKMEGDFLVLSTGWKREDELGSTSTFCIYHVDCNLIIYKNPAYVMK